jgi:hypothetical protein
MTLTATPAFITAFELGYNDGLSGATRRPNTEPGGWAFHEYEQGYESGRRQRQILNQPQPQQPQEES